MKRNMGRKEFVREKIQVPVGAGAEHCIVQKAAVPEEVSAELLTLVPTKNKGGREKHDCKVALIRLFISVLKMMRKKVIGCIVLFGKKRF